MSWTYGGVRIYVQELDEQKKQIIARLQPLSEGTVMQVFGYENPTFQVACKVVGQTNVDALLAFLETGSSYTLTESGSGSFSKSLTMASMSAKRDATYYQTIDPQQDCSTPVFSCNLELYD
jgi:hypothetical protein